MNAPKLELHILKLPPLDAMVAHLEENMAAFTETYMCDDVRSFLTDDPETDPTGRFRPDLTYLHVCNDLQIDPLWRWDNETQSWNER